MDSRQFVIVGAGHAGALASLELRRAGFEGRIVLLGEEPHLPYERPPLSKEMLVNADAKPTWLHDQSKLDDAGIDLQLGARAAALDLNAGRVDLEDGRSVPFDRLLLATGGIARQLTVPGGNWAHTLRTLDDALRLKAALRPGQSVAVVGAGVIGLEVASSAAALGCSVTVIEQQSGPMGRSAHTDVQGYINDIHRRNGVDLHYGAQLEAIQPLASGGCRLELASGEVLFADIIVAGIGLSPNVALARQAGLDIDHGIVVDAFGAASQAMVYAAGDAVSFWHPHYSRRVHWQNWQHAQNHGKAVARAMAGLAEAPYAPLPWFWSDQQGVNLQFTGQSNEGDETIVRGVMAEDRFVAFHRLDGKIVGATFVNSGGMVRPVQALISSGLEIPAEALSDPSVSLQKLARPG